MSYDHVYCEHFAPYELFLNPPTFYRRVMSEEAGDAVIICGSSVSQVKSNVDACRDETPLPKVGVAGSREAVKKCVEYEDKSSC